MDYTLESQFSEACTCLVLTETDVIVGCVKQSDDPEASRFRKHRLHGKRRLAGRNGCLVITRQEELLRVRVNVSRPEWLERAKESALRID